MQLQKWSRLPSQLSADNKSKVTVSCYMTPMYMLSYTNQNTEKMEDTDCQDLNTVSPSDLSTAYLIAQPACQTQVLGVTVYCTLELSHGKVHSTHITNFSGLLQTVSHLLHQLYTLFVRRKCIGVVTYCCVHMTCKQQTLPQAGWSTVEHGYRSVVKAFRIGPFKVYEQCLSHLWQTWNQMNWPNSLHTSQHRVQQHECD